MSLLHLSLSGAVGDDCPINVASVRHQIEAAGDFDCVAVDLETLGGSTRVAHDLYGLLRALPVPVATRVQRRCHSAGLLIYMAGALRVAEASAEILIHPTRFSRDQLPEEVTAQTLRQHADTLEHCDDRIVDLFADRTGFDRTFFENEKSTEDFMDMAAAVECGIVHLVEGVTGPCDLLWPARAAEAMRHRIHLPSRLTSQNYREACRLSPIFADFLRKKETPCPS